MKTERKLDLEFCVAGATDTVPRRSPPAAPCCVKNPVGLGDSSAGKVLACKCKRRDLGAETRVKSGVWKFVNASSQGVETGGSLGSLAASLIWR